MMSLLSPRGLTVVRSPGSQEMPTRNQTTHITYIPSASPSQDLTQTRPRRTTYPFPSKLPHQFPFPSMTTTPPPDKLIIANRGEIAVRICKAAHALSIPTVALYVEADSKALHVKLATESCLIQNYTDGFVKIFQTSCRRSRALPCTLCLKNNRLTLSFSTLMTATR